MIDLFDSSYNINEIMPLLQQFNLHQLINCFYPLVLGNGPSLCPLLPLAITGVENELSQTMLIQFKAAPKQIELQKRTWSHLKVFEKIFQIKLSSFL